MEAAPRPSPSIDPDVDDSVVVRQVQSGDHAAFAALVRKYQDRLFNTCWRLCGNLEDARDLTQEAFLKALGSIQSFREQSQFYTWLFRIAVNMTLSHRRRERYRATQVLDETHEETASGESAGGGHIRLARSEEAVSAMEAGEIHSRVVSAIQSLEEDQRAVVVLRDIEGMDYHQIAELLEIATGTVKSRLHRGRRALRLSLASLVDPRVEEDDLC